MFTDVLHGYVTIVEAINSKTHLTAPADCVYFTTQSVIFLLLCYSANIQKSVCIYKPVPHLLREDECVGGKYMRGKQINALRKQVHLICDPLISLLLAVTYSVKSRVKM